jgi:hypothetical protein
LQSKALWPLKINQKSRLTKIFDVYVYSHGACHHRHTLETAVLYVPPAQVLRSHWQLALGACPTRHGLAKCPGRPGSNRFPRLVDLTSPKSGLCIADISCVFVSLKN